MSALSLCACLALFKLLRRAACRFRAFFRSSFAYCRASPAVDRPRRVSSVMNAAISWFTSVAASVESFSRWRKTAWSFGDKLAKVWESLPGLTGFSGELTLEGRVGAEAEVGGADLFEARPARFAGACRKLKGRTAGPDAVPDEDGRPAADFGRDVREGFLVNKAPSVTAVPIVRGAQNKRRLAGNHQIRERRSLGEKNERPVTPELTGAEIFVFGERWNANVAVTSECGHRGG